MNAPAIPYPTKSMLALRRRGDLEFRAQRFATRRYWAVKDPVALKYFHLGEDEYRLLHLLDRSQSLEELRERFNETLAPRRASLEQVQRLLATLHQFGLVYSAAAGQSEQLLKRRHEQRGKRRWEQLAGMLAIRLPGINPRPLVDRIYPLTGWIFSPTCVVLTLLAAAVAAVLLVTHLNEVEARLPHLDAIVGASNLPWLVLSLAMVKSAHELGHALACRRLGGDCHEMGLMMLVFSPALYCNVSDAWMMPNKWHRIAISAAGMYVELILATGCAVVWWFSQPGLVHSLSLNIVVICSLGTLLLNGNPLLRYDGYYILSDLVEVPNLKSQASLAVRRLAARIGLGIELPTDRLPEGHQGWLILYAVGSAVYRLLMIGMVLWALDRILRPLHLEVLVFALGAFVLGGLVWPPLARWRRWLQNPARRGIAALRLVAALTVAALVLAAVAWIPVPTYVSAPLLLEYRDARRVYVSVPGIIASAVPVGQLVSAGETIVQLENGQVRRELTQLRSNRDRQRLVVANLEARQLQGAVIGSELPAAKAILADLEQRLEQLQRDATRLTLIAPSDGVVLAPPNVPAEPLADRTLATWTGTPLDPQNLGATLESGTLACLVGSPHCFEAILNLDERDVEQVRVGQPVALRLDHLPGEVITGRIEEVARLDLDVMPRELAALGALPAEMDPSGRSRPLDTWYQARVRLDGEPANLIARMPGRASVEVDSRSLGARLMRRLKQTFAL